MLIRFEVSNFRSIAAPVELTMVAVDQDRPAAREQSMLGESLLPVAAIYGPNASGKSNLIAAVAWLQQAVQYSLQTWEDVIPVEPFAFGAWPGEASEFAIEYMVEGVRFEYSLILDRKSVQYEGLFHYPEKKRRRVFEREGSELKFQRGLGGLSGTRELLTERTLALSAARRFDARVVSDFARKIIEISVLSPRTRYSRKLRGNPMLYMDGRRVRVRRRPALLTEYWFQEGLQPSLFSDDELGGSDRQRALALLRLADLGIDDVIVESDENGVEQVRLIHNTTAGRVPFDFGVESEGTRTWFELIGPVLTALREGATVLFDELDASLHPTLSAQLIDLFHDPATNPRGAQLVFTSHDTSLLNHLNRDEVWLTEKNPDGSTRLGALADFAGERVRKSQNLENAYLHGRFGALPQVDQSELLRALGLIG
ncbi:ATP/GTP-binding protein [Kutzneria sp. 744]|uniref:AAA family ATPase n=1 Tax=Kutzneria sp. (strain 744) TaxID=345341 RepID=UPI0003EEB413|nr:ATP-binding protein [Kutzneria sp. 744]EWM17912.1 abortive infection protein [Kutzneria sp. 744]